MVSFALLKVTLGIYFFVFQGKVVIIRGEGPKGGPGMPEMLTPTSAIMGAGLGKVCNIVYFLYVLLKKKTIFSSLNEFYAAISSFFHVQEVALLTDGRFSGGSHGYVVGHICPEAQVINWPTNISNYEENETYISYPTTK